MTASSWMLEFIEIYKEQTCLWDKSSNDYQNDIMKNLAYSLLLEKVWEIDKAATTDTVIEKINELARDYEADVIRDKEQDNQEPWIYRPYLSFMSPQTVIETVTDADTSNDSESHRRKRINNPKSIISNEMKPKIKYKMKNKTIEMSTSGEEIKSISLDNIITNTITTSMNEPKTRSRPKSSNTDKKRRKSAIDQADSTVIEPYIIDTDFKTSSAPEQENISQNRSSYAIQRPKRIRKENIKYKFYDSEEEQINQEGRKEKKNLEGREQKKNIDGREQKKSINGREGNKNIDYQEQKKNINGREEKENIDGREENEFIDDREQIKNIEGREQKKNIDGREQKKSIDGREENEYIDDGGQKKNKDAREEKKSIDGREERRNIDVRDDCVTFADHVLDKLRTFDYEQKCIAQKLMSDVMFFASMKCLKMNSAVVLDPSEKAANTS